MLATQTTATNDLKITFGEWLTLRRKKAGLSQGKLGEAIDRTRQNISDWERGKNKPELAFRQYRILKEQLGCTYEELDKALEDEFELS